MTPIHRLALVPLAALPFLGAASPVSADPAPPAPLAVVQDDDEEEKPDKRPEVKELLDKLKDHARARGKEDQEAIATIDRLLVEFPESGPKDRKSIADGVSDCLKVRRRPNAEGLRDNKLYLAAAVALGEMGPESVRELRGWIEHKSHDDDIPLQRALILSLGKTEHEDGVDDLVDLLVHHEPSIQAAAAEALANYAGLEQRERKDVFKEVLDAVTTAKNQVDSDPNDTIARERYDVIAGPMITTLQILSGHDERDPSMWRRWWNNHKREDWDEGEDG